MLIFYPKKEITSCGDIFVDMLSTNTKESPMGCFVYLSTTRPIVKMKDSNNYEKEDLYADRRFTSNATINRSDVI